MEKGAERLMCDLKSQLWHMMESDVVSALISTVVDSWKAFFNRLETKLPFSN